MGLVFLIALIIAVGAMNQFASYGGAAMWIIGIIVFIGICVLGTISKWIDIEKKKNLFK